MQDKKRNVPHGEYHEAEHEPEDSVSVDHDQISDEAIQGNEATDEEQYSSRDLLHFTSLSPTFLLGSRTSLIQVLLFSTTKHPRITLHRRT